MKRRSKLLAALTAGVMAASAMCFGFAQWSTRLALNGTVSASGTWDVGISKAEVTSFSTGTSIDAEPVAVAPTGNAVVYPVKLAIRDLDNWYVLQIDDLNGAAQALTEVELNEYADRLSFSYGSASPWYYASGIKAEKTTTFMMKITDSDAVTIHSNGLVNQSYQNTDDGASAGKVVGYAILRLWGGSSSALSKPNNQHLQVTYQSALEEIQQGETRTTYPAAICDDQTSATYAPVTFSLPGAWVHYSVTLTNQGTANANLSNYALNVDQLDKIYHVDMPELGENEVLKPGESCTMTFVISVDSQESFQSITQSLSVYLTYVQDAVEAAPTASHTHPGA